MLQLISATYLKEARQLSNNVKDDRLDMFIMQAQNLDIKPFLGEIFYYQLQTVLASFIPTPGTPTTPEQTNYNNLYEGLTFVNSNGYTIIYEGLKPMIESFAFARYIQWDSQRFSATGAQRKEHEQASILSEKDIARMADQIRSEANAHANEVQRYLRNFHTEFPNYWFNLRNRQGRQPGPRITGIDKNSYNYPGAYNTNLPPNWFMTNDYW